jgi:hypothetical protein
MIQSIQASNTAIYAQAKSILGNAKVSTSEETAATQEDEKNDDETTTTSIQGDTLTISNAGAQQAAKAQQTSVPDIFTKSTELSTDEGYTDANAAAISSAASGIGITEYSATKNENSVASAVVSSGSGSSSTSSTSSESNLSQYSDYELKQMLENDEITQAEYNAEIKSRQENDSDDEDDSDDSSVANANATEE